MLAGGQFNLIAVFLTFLLFYYVFVFPFLLYTVISFLWVRGCPGEHNLRQCLLKLVTNRRTNGHWDAGPFMNEDFWIFWQSMGGLVLWYKTTIARDSISIAGGAVCMTDVGTRVDKTLLWSYWANIGMGCLCVLRLMVEQGFFYYTKRTILCWGS